MNLDLFELFETSYLSLHVSSPDSRYYVQFFLSVKIRSTYDYIWDIALMEGLAEDFLKKKYRSTRLSETINICITDSYQPGLVKLWDLQIYIKNLSEAVKQCHEVEFQKGSIPMVTDSEVLKYEQFIENPPSTQPNDTPAIPATSNILSLEIERRTPVP